MSRWKAAAIHLSISAVIGLVSAALIFGVWYPPPYSHAAGADQLILLLLGVDVVLGPLLTFVVFRTGKRGLRFDLAVIALAQICAFTYGMSVVVRARPAFIVGAIDRFSLVTANDLTAVDLSKASKPEFRSPPWSGPRIVGAEPPTDIAARNDLTFSAAGGKDIDKYPQYYVDYSTVTAQLLAHAKLLDGLRQKHPDSIQQLDTWLHDHRRDAASVVWVPINARRAALTMLLDRSTGQTLDALPIDPW
ncbi:TfpX/TfpZ family type IV pilin accessory protein [Dokdonella soli]|uniref:Type IV pilin accessory protein n=1 Tax=Dokdonella soli TaxID=529810 RepID=A0ABN1II71_9GAMM